jgi:WhiB family transcriptional regulator, redox-sensing transcriptional regulator
VIKPDRLPAPVLESYEWQDRGLCRGMPAGLFFDADGDRGGRRTRQEEAAKEVCRRCPVIAKCRDHAIAAEYFGVWGGLTAVERSELRRARSGGKADAA